MYTSNGNLLDFIVYNGNITPQLIEKVEGGLITGRIPAYLMARYFGKGHNMYIDDLDGTYDWLMTLSRMAQMSQNYQ